MEFHVLILYDEMLSKTSNPHLKSVEIRNNRPIPSVSMNEMEKKGTNRSLN